MVDISAVKRWWFPPVDATGSPLESTGREIICGNKNQLGWETAQPGGAARDPGQISRGEKRWQVAQTVGCGTNTVGRVLAQAGGTPSRRSRRRPRSPLRLSLLDVLPTEVVNPTDRRPVPDR